MTEPVKTTDLMRIPAGATVRSAVHSVPGQLHVVVVSYFAGPANSGSLLLAAENDPAVLDRLAEEFTQIGADLGRLAKQALDAQPVEAPEGVGHRHPYRDDRAANNLTADVLAAHGLDTRPEAECAECGQPHGYITNPLTGVSLPCQ
jgi:hypothetical protein